MKKIILYTLSLIIIIKSIAQETIYPAPLQNETIILTNGTIHVGNGQVISNGSLVFKDGKIIEVSKSTTINGKVIDCKNKDIYPGLILSDCQLGIVEIPTVRASIDATELGEINPSMRAIVAYNTDSKVINTLRPNGILMANISPTGSLIAGSSSVVQLDAWNWEDAAYNIDAGIHFYMPSLLNRPKVRGGTITGEDVTKLALTQIEKVKAFFREAKAFLAAPNHTNNNLKYQAVSNLFNKKQKLFVHCNLVKEMLLTIDFVKEFNFDVVIVGGVDSWQIADILKQNNIAVILNKLHSLPVMVDDDIDQPFKTPAILQKAGVLFCINDDDENSRNRNLPFNAGTACAYGLTKEEALSAITLNAAKILGIADKTGSIEVGKDANIVVSQGDILDMQTNVITHAFIQGRQIDLNNKQKQLFEKYKIKYGVN